MPTHPNFFRQFAKVSDCLVETGTYLGEGVIHAVNGGFKEVHTIEIDKPLYDRARAAFAPYTQISIYLGDSSKILSHVLDIATNLDRTKRVTCWLDGHYSGPGTGGADNPQPIMQELDAVAKWASQNPDLPLPIILIDDCGYFRDPPENQMKAWGFTISQDQLEARVRQILGPNTKFSYQDGYQTHIQKVLPNDIMIATADA